jgi:pectate lyase
MNTPARPGQSAFSPAITLLFIAVIAAPLSAQPNFDLVGFATQNGGTTGGKGGETVTAASYSQLKNYAESSTRYIIKVMGTISNGGNGGVIGVNSNKSIIGVGSSAFLNGIAFSIKNSNIIIRNLKVTLVGTSNPGGVNGGDVLSIAGSAKNIWVDHCEFYSEDPDVQKDIDKYDGLIDVRDQTGFITFSWNYLHDHHKCGIVGSSDDDLYGDRKITYHHNYYRNVKYRMPMYRGSVGHFFNNYIAGAQDATEIRTGTCVRVEKNYYEKLHYSIYSPTDYPGSTERIDNIEVERASRAYPSNCTAAIPYAYADALTNTTADVKTIVPQYAGVGKTGNDPSGIAPEFAVAPGSAYVPASHAATVGRARDIRMFDLLGKPVVKGSLIQGKLPAGIVLVFERGAGGLSRITPVINFWVDRER